MLATILMRLLIGLGVMAEVGVLVLASGITGAPHAVTTLAWPAAVLVGVPLVWIFVAFARRRIRHLSGRETSL
jgi:uncharacterized membrane protein